MESLNKKNYRDIPSEWTNHQCSSTKEMKKWLTDLRVEDVECLIPDLSGIARGKVIPTKKFISSLDNEMLFIPYDIFTQLVTGNFADQVDNKKLYHDLRIVPDFSSIRLSPWITSGTLVAQVICDVETLDRHPVHVSPRQVLKNVLQKFQRKALVPIISPEIEFYLVKKNLDSDYPLEPAIGVSGRNESGSQAYGIEALNEYEPFIDLLYNYCDQSRIDIDTVLHEGGSAQLEVNFVHSNPLHLADQVFLFKRTAREAAKKQGIYLTFMAKPHSNQPGSSMHLHQSLYSNGQNIFSDPKQETQFSKEFHHYIGGLQKYLPESSLINFPNINSFKRIQKFNDSPINTFWGIDNRSVGLRVPKSGEQSRRVENRLPGSDVNPYLTIALSLICGLSGLEEKISPLSPVQGIANQSDDSRTIPYHPYEAIQLLQSSEFLKKSFGNEFIDVFTKVKQEEIDLCSNLVTAWEREHLLLTV